MECNKDEAERCIESALDSYDNGNVEKAIRLLKKSITLFPIEKAKTLLARYETKLSEAGSSDNHNNSNNNSNSNGVHHRGSHNNHHHGQQHNSHHQQNQHHNEHNKHHTNANANANNNHANKRSGSPPKETRAYTVEQIELVKRVRKCKNYYEILEVPKDASDSDIKKAYRKIALLLHPDKNPAPNADEAFKSVSQAFSCLSDPDKRRHYDQFGAESTHPTASSGGMHHDGMEMTPEELFNFFFNGVAPSRTRGGFHRGGGFDNVYMYNFGSNRRSQRQQPQNAGGIASIIHLLPILLLIMITYFSSSSSDEPVYLFRPTPPYNHQFFTKNNIPYFVKSEAADQITSNSINKVRLDEEVEQTYVSRLQYQCKTEQSQRERIKRAASFSTGEEKNKLMNDYNSYSLPSCDDYQKFIASTRVRSQ
eukprot:TRINITY_DN773_c0_g2_i1.p1 TRINITY_DN773_c0_g2~~TRINITY_DN773_c0_g2_i1.p1  ORF type:complete len:423 (-),score=92.34 TRINITY_DN773_c0_g2_i1:115-1383(-)